MPISMTPATIRKTVCDVLREVSGQVGGRIRNNMRLQRDLGIGEGPIGSAEFLILREELEKKLGVRIPAGKVPSLEELDKRVCVADVVKLCREIKLPSPLA